VADGPLGAHQRLAGLVQDAGTLVRAVAIGAEREALPADRVLDDEGVRLAPQSPGDLRDDPLAGRRLLGRLRGPLDGGTAPAGRAVHGPLGLVRAGLRSGALRLAADILEHGHLIDLIGYW
jgi:hypothetical protein